MNTEELTVKEAVERGAENWLDKYALDEDELTADFVEDFFDELRYPQIDDDDPEEFGFPSYLGVPEGGWNLADVKIMRARALMLDYPAFEELFQEVILELSHLASPEMISMLQGMDV